MLVHVSGSLAQTTSFSTASIRGNLVDEQNAPVPFTTVALHRSADSSLVSGATADQADYVIVDLDTYGGALNNADAIRTRILEYPKPVYVFVNKNAA